MALKFTFSGTDVEVVAGLNSIVDKIGPALVEKMTLLMTKLQQKARARTRVARVKASIRDPRAELQGTNVVGHLNWGGESTTVSYKGGKAFDLALIFEEGTKQHAINPLGLKGELGGKRQHIAGGAKRIGAPILVWPVPYTKGDKAVIFAKYAFPKGIIAEHYMSKAVAEMKDEFVRGIEDTIRTSIQNRFRGNFT